MIIQNRVKIELAGQNIAFSVTAEAEAGRNPSRFQARFSGHEWRRVSGQLSRAKDVLNRNPTAKAFGKKTHLGIVELPALPCKTWQGKCVWEGAVIEPRSGTVSL